MMFTLGCLLLVLAAPTIRAASVTCNEFPVGRRVFTDDPPFNLMPLPLCPSEIAPTYTMYTRTSRGGGTLTDVVVPSNFNPSHKTIFVIHGWNTDSSTSSWMTSIMNDYLDVGNYNIVIVDWRGCSRKANYNQSASCTRTNGAWAAVVMRNLVNMGLSWNNLYCVGHSLGAHSCGHAGNWDSGIIGRVTGLDPAGPMFQGQTDMSVGLYSGSGKFVDVIHTDDDTYGTRRKMGHMDFYPNDGSGQPGCIADVSGCSHGRAHAFYVVSIKDNCFACRQTCTDEYNLPGSCTTHSLVRARMGAWAEGSGSNGMYRLTTTGSSPYCQN